MSSISILHTGNCHLSVAIVLVLIFSQRFIWQITNWLGTITIEYKHRKYAKIQQQS